MSYIHFKFSSPIINQNQALVGQRNYAQGNNFRILLQVWRLIYSGICAQMDAFLRDIKTRR